QAQRDAAREQAKAEARRVEQALITKNVAFGTIVVESDGTIDHTQVQGVDQTLTIRPFGWKGHQATLRGMAEESLHIHQGLLSNGIQLAVGSGSLAPAPCGKGKWYDVDEDGVSLEIDSGMLTTVVGYLAQLESPVVRPPRDPRLLDAWADRRLQF